MLTQVLASVFLLALCIFFHELGHFLIGKWMGVQPKIFSIGYGRGVFYKKVGRTLYQLTAIPLGGYVQFYGDDITKEKTKLRKGDFFSVGPWRRIALAAGGPFFSVLLGFIVIFFLYAFGYQNISNKIQVVENPKQMLPAQTAGLQTGDQIVKINGRPTVSFEKINYLIGFADKPQIDITYIRDGKTHNKTVEARKPEPGLPFQIGIQPMGKNLLVVAKDKDLGTAKLKEGDILLSAQEVPLHKITDLHKVLNENVGKEVSLKVKRKDSGIISASERELTVKAKVHEAETLTFTHLVDKQTQAVLEDVNISSWDTKAFQKIFINGKNFTSWKELKQAILQTDEINNNQTNNNEVPNETAQKSKTLQFSIEAVTYQAQAAYKPRGILGVSLGEMIQPDRTAPVTSLTQMLQRTSEQTWFVAESTLVGLWAIITGKLSFNKSMAGPVKIVSFAAQSVEQGWEQYWYLLAHITIILGVMNMLPIPVLDGGHVVFYLIEAFYKPLKASTIAASVRVGMVFLLTFGVYVIGHDIWDLFLKKFFS